MALTPSTMLPLETPAPEFQLTDVATGNSVRRDDFQSAKGLLVVFLCNHCPYVVHVRKEMVKVANEYVAKGVGVVAINSNSAKTHPQDGPANMKKLAADENWNFPFCFDENQAVAKAFRAACTPDFFLFGSDLKLKYRGQFDDARPGNNKPIDGRDLRAALDAVLAGKLAPAVQKPSLGCNIKWNAGTEPAY